MIPFVDITQQTRAISAELQQAIDDVLAQSDFIEGRAVGRFEKAFAGYIGTSAAIGVGSGYDALELALRALEIGPGDEVVVPANSYIASAFACTNVGATPVFIDCDPLTYQMDIDSLPGKITARTRAIMPVHLTGQPVEMAPLLEFATRHGLRVIEDVAQAHGASYRGARCGSMGDVGCFSFYPSKNLGAFGDGGAITTNSEELANRVRRLKNFGQDRKYHHVEIGRNARLDTVQAAIIEVKLRHLDGWNALRRQNAARYRRELSGVGDLHFPSPVEGTSHVYHLMVIETAHRDALQQHLKNCGIETVLHYPTPIPLQPAYANLGHRKGDFPVAERLAARTLSLPMFPELTECQIAEIATEIRKYFAKLPAEALDRNAAVNDVVVSAAGQ